MATSEHLSKPFTTSRTLDAPRQLVFDAFTKLEHLGRWMCPQGLTPVDGTLDLRPGGVYHYGMQVPGGPTMYGQWLFREIVAPERLVCVVQFSDKDGGITRHPMAPTWPLSTLSTTTFIDQGDKTLLTLTWQALDANPLEEATFDMAHASMEQGWSGTLETLSAYLSEVRKPA
jgi:uncharacterized protein YndB with AHSA1/START domain